MSSCPSRFWCLTILKLMLYCSCMLGRTHCLNWVPQSSFSSSTRAIKEVKHPFFFCWGSFDVYMGSSTQYTLERICFCRPQFDKDQKSWSIFSMVANIKLLLSIVNFEQTKASEVQVGSSKGDNCTNLIKIQ